MVETKTIRYPNYSFAGPPRAVDGGPSHAAGRVKNRKSPRQTGEDRARAPEGVCTHIILLFYRVYSGRPPVVCHTLTQHRELVATATTVALAADGRTDGRARGFGPVRFHSFSLSTFFFLVLSAPSRPSAHPLRLFLLLSLPSLSLTSRSVRFSILPVYLH